MEGTIITKEGGNIVHAGWAALDPALAEAGRRMRKEAGS